MSADLTQVANVIASIHSCTRYAYSTKTLTEVDPLSSSWQSLQAASTCYIVTLLWRCKSG